MTPGPAPRVGVLTNPAAGGRRTRAARRRVLDGLAARGLHPVDLGGDAPDRTLRRAREAARTGLAGLVAVGGDGTVHLGVGVVAGTALPLGVVACGGGNDLARALGLPVHDVAAALDVVAGGLQGAARVVDAVEVTGPDGRSPRWYLGVLSAGIDAAVNARANGMSWPTGRARYVRALTAELPGLRPYGYRVRVDGRSVTFAGTLVAVANGSTFGGGMRIAPDARLDDGLLDVVLVGPVGRWELARVFPLVYAGRHLSHPAVRVVRGGEVELEPHPSGATPPAAYADGEPLGALPLRCTVRPRAVRVLAPPPTGGAAA